MPLLTMALTVWTMGHFHLIPLGQFQRSGQGIHALDHHADFLDGIFRGLALADEDTGAVVAAVHTGSRHDEVADAGQTCEGVDIAAHRHAQTGDLGDAAGDEGSAGIIAVAEAGGDADAQRDDVLHGAAQLYTLDVLVGVDAHDIVGEDLLHIGSGLHILAGRHDGGGQVDGHFLAWVGPDRATRRTPFGPPSLPSSSARISVMVYRVSGSMPFATSTMIWPSAT